MTEQEQSVVNKLIDSSGKLLGNMPVQFLMLAIINLIFIVGLLWFMDRREQQRERLFAPYLAACERQIPTDALDKLFEHFKDITKDHHP